METREHDGQEHLADIILNSPPHEWRMAMPRTGEIEVILLRLQHSLIQQPIFVADSVSDYWWRHPKQYWTYKDDFPDVSPPLPDHTDFFVEAGKPDEIRIGKSRMDAGPHAPERFGYFFSFISTLVAGHHFPVPSKSGSMAEFTLLKIPHARWLCRAMPVTKVEGQPGYIPMFYLFAVDGAGRIVVDPIAIGNPANPFFATRENFGEAYEAMANLLMPALLSVCFAHRGSLYRARPPRAESSRLRRSQGLMPLRRYYLIDTGLNGNPGNN